MKTDDLVTMLSANVEPVGRGLVGRAISIAVAAGAVTALGIMLVGLGVRADLTTTRAIVFLSLKLAFAIAVVGVAVRYLTKLARVGRGATEAEDLLQEVLLAIHLKRHTYDTGELFTPWVYTIARYNASRR